MILFSSAIKSGSESKSKTGATATMNGNSITPTPTVGGNPEGADTATAGGENLGKATEDVVTTTAGGTVAVTTTIGGTGAGGRVITIVGNEIAGRAVKVGETVNGRIEGAVTATADDIAGNLVAGTDDKTTEGSPEGCSVTTADGEVTNNPLETETTVEELVSVKGEAKLEAREVADGLSRIGADAAGKDRKTEGAENTPKLDGATVTTGE